VLAAVLFVAAGCGGKSSSDAAGPGPAATTGQPSGTTQPPKSDAPPTTGRTTTTSSTTSDWPNPEDCISYNPSTLTTAFSSGVYTVSSGSVAVIRVHGQQGDNTGQKALALAQHYKRHCFIGRNNPRPDPGPYSMDYWRDSSGQNPTIPDQDNDCSPYNRNNLTVEDMGGGDGWRVKDHDHVLHLFDNETDARNGKLVLSKYDQICFIGNPPDSNQGQDQVSYEL